jgi:hypothetical protein
MKRILMAAIVMSVLAGAVSVAAQKSPLPHPSERHLFTGQVLLGYYGGVGIQASGTLTNFAEDFPFQVRLGLGCNYVDAGNALLARQVFINNNTNGTPQKRGKMWDVRLDVLYPVKLLSLKRTMLFAGPRHSNFDAHFEYIGGAETFDVTDNQWGVGSGVETAFALSPRVDMIVTGGVDYYFPGTLSGHDTYYRPNNDNTHPIDNYTYKDAEAAINQPELKARMMLGVAYHF